MADSVVKKFLDTHRNIELSPAKLEYSQFLYKGIDEVIANSIGCKNNTAEDEVIAAQISNTTDGNDYIRLMRKQLSGLNKYNLRQKILLNENLVMPLIKERALSNMQDIFTENALYFFLHCNENVSDWIVENYASFKSEYLKSMFCLVLGFRGEKELIPFLISEAERLEKLYPNESYDQGPTLAVQELAYRFLN